MSGFCGFHWLQRVFGREVGPVSTRINPIDNDLIEFYFFFLPGLTVIDQEVQSAVPAHGTSRPLNLDGRISWGISDLRPALRFFFWFAPFRLELELELDRPGTGVLIRLRQSLSSRTTKPKPIGTLDSKKKPNPVRGTCLEQSASEN